MKALFALCMIVHTSLALAWGPTGQTITVQIAEKFLTPQARQKVLQLTGNKALSSFAIWADGVRNTPDWGQTGVWHYINVDDRGNYQHESGGAPDDVLSALQFCIKNFKEGNPNQRLDWLKFIVHLVGDIHQPMHVGNPNDRGGNETTVIYGKSMNLHFLWDSAMIDRSKLSPADYTARLISQSRPQNALKEMFDPNVVISENFALRKFLYSYKNGKIDGQYEQQALVIIDERLWTGGLRLASLLNSILK